MTLVSVVLAAGSATRFGGDKLTAPFRGQPLLHHAIRAARAAPVERVLVVCPPSLDIGAWDASPPVETVEIDSDALSASLKAGIAAARDADGAFVFLGDMPLIPHGVAGRLADILGDRFAGVPRHGEANGHPVLFSARAFQALMRLEGDQGGGALLKTRDDIAFLDVADDAIALDVDRTEDLARLEDRATRGG